MNYSGCLDEELTYQYRLDTLSYIENTLVIQNKNSHELIMKTEEDFCVLASNAWFYWTIALACLLLINLVVLTGIVFYWSLKYKKTKRKF